MTKIGEAHIEIVASDPTPLERIATALERIARALEEDVWPEGNPDITVHVEHAPDPEETAKAAADQLRWAGPTRGL